MKKILFLILALSALNCTSVKKYNQIISNNIAVEQLHKDVDFTYKKLKQLQPQLYNYITKEKLDFKFDSLKKSITTPLTPLDFYEKIAPVVCEVRQGHLQMYPPTKKYSKKEIEVQKNRGKSPLSQFKYEIFNDKLFIAENNSADSTINKYSEITEINNQKVSDVLPKYKKLLTSDGFNTTFTNKFVAMRFRTLFGYFNKTKDSTTLKLNQNGETTTKTITFLKKKTAKKLSKEELKAKKETNSVNGFDPDSNEYMRQISFLDKDSLTAKLSIKGWRIGDYKKFYDQTFALINKKKVKNLILDLRFNTGGRLDEIFYINKYLSNQPEFTFSEKSEVTSRTSLFYADYFKGTPWLLYPITTSLSPLYYGYHYFKVKKENNKYYWYFNSSKPAKTLPNHYSNQLYVLINGASFSASAIISSSLKGNKRATFIGEETGGDYNGTVAGRMPLFELPNSKLNIKIGLMAISATEKTPIIGHGIYPDVTINPTIEDRLKNIDPELNWVIKDIETKSKL